MELAGIPASERDRLEDLTSVYLEAMTPAMLAISDDDRATGAEWTVVGIIAGLKMAVLLQDFLEREGGRGDRASALIIEEGQRQHAVRQEAQILREFVDGCRLIGDGTEGNPLRVEGPADARWERVAKLTGAGT